MNEISVINVIEVPQGMNEEAEMIRNVYVDYFRKQDGFVSSTFYRSINPDSSTRYVNVVVWDSLRSFEKVVNSGFSNIDGVNKDGMKVLGKGFPHPIKVMPDQYEVIAS